MSCVDRLPHSCGTQEGLAVFENDGHYSGYCFACRKYIRNPYGDGEAPRPKKQRIQKTAEEVQAEIEEISTYQSLPLPDRKLTQETISYFNIKTAVSEEDGQTITLHFYPVTLDGALTGYKVRDVEHKRFWSIGKMSKDSDFFGWEQAITTGAKRLYITEGEIDCASVFQVLKEKNRGTQWEKYDPAIVSLVNGASSAAHALAANAAKIKQHFKEVVLVFDNDDAGKKAFDDAIRVFPTALGVSYPEKDPNDCLLKGRSIALLNALVFKSEVKKNTRLVNASSLFSIAREKPKWGLSWPWQGLTDLTRGMRFGETYYWGAGVKMGKSEVVNALGAHMIKEHGLKIMMAKPEEANVKSVKMVASKMVGSIFHDPKIEMDFEAYDKGTGLIGDSLLLLNLYQHLGWNSLKDDITQAVGEGVKAVFIDPITNLSNGVEAGQANTLLQDISQQLSAMALDLNIVVHIFCHLKAPDVGPSHERGGKVLSNQFAGSRAMMRSCNMMIGLEGNKDPDLDEEERNTRRLVLLEDREFGASGSISLYWNPRTGLFSEIRK